MSLLQFSAACMALVLATHYVILPWVRWSVRRRPTHVSLPKIAWMAVIRYARGVALVAVLTSLTVAGLVEVMRFRASSLMKVSAVRQALAMEHNLKQKLDDAHPYWFGTCAILLTSALGYYTYRRRKLQCSAAYSAAQDAEVARLVKAMNEDPTWWDLPPDSEMQRVINRIVEIQEQYPSLPDQYKPGAEQAVEQLRRILIQLDIVRRMNVTLDPDAIEDPKPETWREWASGLVGSPRVAGATRRGTRMLYRFNAILLVVGLIGLQSAGITKVFQDRIVVLDDLGVRLSNLESVEQEVALAEADAKVETPESEEKPTSSSTTPRIQTPSARVDAKVKDLKVKAEKAAATKPSYVAEDADFHRVVVEADARAAKARRFDDLFAEIRRNADEVGVETSGKPDPSKPRPPSGPGDPGERLTNLREQLNKDFAKVDPDRFVKPKAYAVKARLEGLDPEAELRTINNEVAAAEHEATSLKAAVDSRPALLEEKLRTVGSIEGRSEEIVALRRRVEGLKSLTGERYVTASRELKAVQQAIASERSLRVAELAPRQAQAALLASRVEEIDRLQSILPAKADEASSLLSAADSKVAWEKARPFVPNQRLVQAARDVDDADVIARAYEEAVGDAPAVRELAPQPDPAISKKLRAMATRDAILDHAAKVAPSERVRPPSLSDAPGLTDTDRAVAKSAQSMFRNQAPRTPLGQAMRDQIVREMRLSPGFRETVVAQAPAARARLRGGWGISPRSPPGQRFWSELSLTAFDTAVQQVAGPEVSDIVGEISRSTLKNYEAAQRYEFIRNLAGGEKNLQSALDRIVAGGGKATLTETGSGYLRQVNTRTIASGNTVRAVAPYEPAIEVPFERGVNLERAGSIVMEQASRGEPAAAAYRARTFSEPLENYSGAFPSQPGIERVTPRGQLLEAISSNADAVAKGTVPKGWLGTIDARKLSETWSASRKFSTIDSLVKIRKIEPPRVALPSNAINSAEKARSFLRLITSPKVGGVLIGRKADPAGAWSFQPSALRWEVGPSDVRLTLVRPDGSESRSRPFRRDLTELALAYAADGRPIAVTIITAQPLYDRKVLLHPSLVNTAAGKAITRTDMIIFQLIENEPWYLDAYIAVKNQVELYRRAWAIRQSVLGPLEVLKPEYVKEVERQLNEGAEAYGLAKPGLAAGRDDRRSAIQYMSAASDKEGVVSALTRTARDPDAIGDPSRSPLTVKAAYFDPELVADLIASSRPGRSLVDFDAAIRQATLNRLGDLADWLKSRGQRERDLSARIESFNVRATVPGIETSKATELKAEWVKLKADLDAFESTSNANRARIDVILRRWTAPVPELAHVSGIRERAFTRTEADCFAAEGKDLPMVLDFLIQITYDTLPYFLKGAPPASEDKEGWEALTSYADDNPWEFPEISGRVREVVRKALETDAAMAEDRDSVATLAEFTILQRLFRLGLAGELGPDFPIESLALLHRDAAPETSPAPVRTPRWDTRPGLLERSLKQYADRELGVDGSPKKTTALPSKLTTQLKTLSGLVDEYAAKVAERDKALDTLDAAPPGAEPSTLSWEATWDAFQTWAVAWEDRLAEFSAVLDRKPSTVAPLPNISDPTAKFEIDLDMNPYKQKTEEIISTVRWTSSAIALRRALDVNTDDKLARAAKRGRPASQTVSTDRSTP